MLKVHTRNKPLAPDVNLKTIAQTTVGFTGADLENLVNEASLLAARADRKAITKEDIEEAIDREYKDLLEEYNSIIETIQDYDYSTDFRSKYLYKLNKLLDSPNRYTKNGWYHIDLGDFEDNFETNKDEDKEILRSIAARNVYKKILGND